MTQFSSQTIVTHMSKHNNKAGVSSSRGWELKQEFRCQELRGQEFRAKSWSRSFGARSFGARGFGARSFGARSFGLGVPAKLASCVRREDTRVSSCSCNDKSVDMRNNNNLHKHEVSVICASKLCHYEVDIRQTRLTPTCKSHGLASIPWD